VSASLRVPLFRVGGASDPEYTGGPVEVADLGDALLIVPTGRGGLRSMLREAIQEAGGYSKLAGQVAAEDADLA
jgi:hypothetical protein